MATNRGEPDAMKPAIVSRSKTSDSKEYIQAIQFMTSEYQTRLGLKFNQDVRQYKDVPSKKINRYRFRRVVSPSEFYLEYANLPEPRIYDNWFIKMQEFYMDPENRKACHVDEDFLILARCYVCRDETDNNWHRVRLHHLKKAKNSTTSVFVYYLDLCKMQETVPENLLELEATFAEIPAQVFRCYLHDIAPAGDDELKWSEEACKHFKSLVMNKDFKGIVLTRSNTLVATGMPDVCTNLGVVLIESVPSDSKTDMCTLNAQMVDARFAVATGVCAGCHHITEVDDCVPSFDALEFDRIHEIEQPSAEPKSEPANAEEDEGRLLTTSGLSFKTAEKIGLDAYYRNATEYLPDTISRGMCPVNLVCITAPSLIMVQDSRKQEEVKLMQNRLEEMVKNKTSLDNGKPGMLVACHVVDFLRGRSLLAPRNEEERFWSRGVITGLLFDKTELSYKILLVDYGLEVTLSPIDTRRLPDYFTTIPSYATRVHLDMENVEPVNAPLGAGWTHESREEFRRYLMAWQKKRPRYYMFRSRNAEVFELDHFSQQIAWNPYEKKWHVLPTVKKLTALYAMKNHVMLRSLFRSVAVEIHYEIVFPESNFWHFAPVLDSLIDQGYARKTQIAKNTSRRHIEIIEEATSNRIERLKITGGGPSVELMKRTE